MPYSWQAAQAVVEEDNWRCGTGSHARNQGVYRPTEHLRLRKPDGGGPRRA